MVLFENVTNATIAPKSSQSLENTGFVHVAFFKTKMPHTFIRFSTKVQKTLILQDLWHFLFCGIFKFQKCHKKRTDMSPYRFMNIL